MLPALPVAAQGVRYEGVSSFASGRYGGDVTLTQFAFNSAIAVERGAWSLRATVPLYVQNNSVIVTTGGGRVGGAGRTAAAAMALRDSARSSGLGTRAAADAVTDYTAGLGDPLLSVTARLPAGFPYSATAGVMLKVPVARTAFGTGEWDAGVSVDVSRVFGRQMLGAGVAWWGVGDVPGYDLRSPWLANVILSRFGVAGGAASLGVFYSTPTQAGVDPAASATLSYGRSLGVVRMVASVGAGFTPATPAMTASLGWGVPLR
jgi:hypothetical protein